MRYEKLVDLKSETIEIRRDGGHWYKISRYKLIILASKEAQKLRREKYWKEHISLDIVINDDSFIFEKAVEESQCVPFEEVPAETKQIEVITPEVIS
jgi:hypothetical protein